MNIQPSTCECKICGRTCKILKNGKVSKHGYTQMGVNTVSCRGAIYRWDATSDHVAEHLDRCAEMDEKRTDERSMASAQMYRQLAREVRNKAAK